MPITYVEESIGGIEMKVNGIGINSSYNIYSKSNINEDASKTEIKSRNKYYGKEAWMAEKTKEKYDRLYNETKHMSREKRRRYISQRYFDSSAPHYIHGLTEKERSSCFQFERDYDYHYKRHYEQGSEMNSFCLHDPMFRGITVNGLVESEKQKLHNRNMINQQIQNILDKNNITIPKGQRLTFSIDPFNYIITVEGLEDEKTKNLIEAVLNEGNNGKELFYHISHTLKANSLQKTKEIYEKYLLMREIKKYTGLNINNLEVKNGKFVTADGRNLMDVYRNGVRNAKYVDDYHKGSVISFYGSLLNKYAKKGINSIPDMVLKIDWQDGSLMDIDTAYGYGKGQERWIEDLTQVI